MSDEEQEIHDTLRRMAQQGATFCELVDFLHEIGIKAHSAKEVLAKAFSMSFRDAIGMGAPWPSRELPPDVQETINRRMHHFIHRE